MSLDLYLVQPGVQLPARGCIFVRRDGAVVEVTRDEWEEMYPGREPTVVELQTDDEVFHGNVTHNLGRMASECGLYEPLWRPLENGWTHARDLVELVRAGVAELQSNRERYELFNPSNGWGSYDLLLQFAVGFLDACERWPNAQVGVWK